MDGHQELAVRLDPLPVRGDSPAGADEVDMRMVFALPRPGMEQGGKPRYGPDPLAPSLER